MRKFLFSIFSFALFAVTFAQTPSSFAQPRTCDLRLKIIEKNKEETDELSTIKGARVTAIKHGSRKTLPAVMVAGQPEFRNLTDGEYKITITKPGFKRTVQRIEFECLAPLQNGVAHVTMERGNPSLTVFNERLKTSAGLIIGRATVISSAEVPPPGKSEETDSSPSRVVISGGVLNGKAVSLPKPDYPAIARSARASGTVTVQILIDEEGHVVAATGVSGHPLLRAAAIQAARAARFAPTLLSGRPVRVSGILNFHFKLEPRPEPRAETE
jgi:TonB family protein